MFAEVKYDRVEKRGKGLDMNALNFQVKAFGFSLKANANPPKDFWTAMICAVLSEAKFPDDLKGFAYELVKVLTIVCWKYWHSNQSSIQN